MQQRVRNIVQRRFLQHHVLPVTLPQPFLRMLSWFSTHSSASPVVSLPLQVCVFVPTGRTAGAWSCRGWASCLFAWQQATASHGCERTACQHDVASSGGVTPGLLFLCKGHTARWVGGFGLATRPPGLNAEGVRHKSVYVVMQLVWEAIQIVPALTLQTLLLRLTLHPSASLSAGCIRASKVHAHSQLKLAPMHGAWLASSRSGWLDTDTRSSVWALGKSKLTLVRFIICCKPSMHTPDAGVLWGKLA